MTVTELLPKVSDEIFTQHLERWRKMWGGTDPNPAAIDDSQSASEGTDEVLYSYTYGDQP